MIVCVCNCVSESKIIETVEKFNLQNLEELQEKIEICNNCCTCQKYVENLIDLTKSDKKE